MGHTNAWWTHSVHSAMPSGPQVDTEKKDMCRWGSTGMSSSNCLMDTEHVQDCWGSWVTCLQSTRSRSSQLGPRPAPAACPWLAEADPELFPAPSFACHAPGTELRACTLYLPCPGAHPERHPCRWGRCGHSCRDDAHTLWRPHRGFLLWHHLHSGIHLPIGEDPKPGAGDVCVPESRERQRG